MSLSSDDSSTLDILQGLEDLDEEEENLLQTKKQLLMIQQFRIDQERKNSVIGTLRKRIETLEDQKSASYIENDQLRQKLQNKEAIESSLNQVTGELENSNDRISLLILESGNLKEELKSQHTRWVPPCLLLSESGRHC